jgi:hypothetical protein
MRAQGAPFKSVRRLVLAERSLGACSKDSTVIFWEKATAMLSSARRNVENILLVMCFFILEDGGKGKNYLPFTIYHLPFILFMRLRKGRIGSWERNKKGKTDFLSRTDFLFRFLP